MYIEPNALLPSVTPVENDFEVSVKQYIISRFNFIFTLHSLYSVQDYRMYTKSVYFLDMCEFEEKAAKYINPY